MSSTDSTDIAKTDESSLASDLDKSLSDSISKKFSNVEIAYVKPDRIRVNVKKEDIILILAGVYLYQRLRRTP